ncbi:glycosyltransferase family 4 protein [Bacillus luti]|uniref:Glycosyltransferase family 4 protein n=1 Tax=Bacillus luti TaxID=2026191 RepID=A0A7V7SE97_9BACI|nr:glycosyltransferase family 4 protein [Bacillus luti]KAB2445577.1 glycosyltransferase family 4 protein [Bacillus luti]
MKMQVRGKVAFVATVYRHIEAFHIPFIKMLQQEGYEVHVYAHVDNSKSNVASNGVICHDISIERSPYNLNNIKAYYQLLKSFREEKFVMAHMHTPMGGVLGRLAAKKAKVGHAVYTAHGFHFFKGAPLVNWLVYYPMEKFLARYTDFLVTINKEDFKRAQSFKVRKKVEYVPGVGVEASNFNLQACIRERKRAELGINQDDFVILCVAELNENKNQVQLINAVKELSNKYKNIKCLLVGIGEKQEDYKEMVVSLKLHNHILFLGFREDIPELMSAADTVTLLSKREGLPKALLEALAASKPLVVTDVRGNRDLVQDGFNGYVVNVSDIEGTVMAFENLITNSQTKKIFESRSREMSKEYELEMIKRYMGSLYDKILN